MRKRFLSMLVMASLMISSLGAPVLAGSEGRRNTAVALGAVTIYGVVKKKPAVAVAGGLGTAYAYSRYKKSKKSEAREEARRQRWYKGRYGRSWRNYYKKGK